MVMQAVVRVFFVGIQALGCGLTYAFKTRYRDVELEFGVALFFLTEYDAAFVVKICLVLTLLMRSARGRVERTLKQTNPVRSRSGSAKCVMVRILLDRHTDH